MLHHDGLAFFPQHLVTELDVALGLFTNGKVLEGGLRVACGEGAVDLKRLQKAGKAAQDVEVFQAGARIAPGTILTGDS